MNLKNYIAKKWKTAFFMLAIFVAGIATGLLVIHIHQLSVPSNPVPVPSNPVPAPSNPALALTIVPTSLSTESIRQGSEFKMTFSFTNTLNRNLEFVTNGPSCFQFLDLKILDQNGENHATLKPGGFYVLSPDERQITVTPGQTAAGTHSIDLIVNGPLPTGTYSAQAFFDYKELHFASNVVQFTVTDH